MPLKRYVLTNGVIRYHARLYLCPEEQYKALRGTQVFILPTPIEWCETEPRRLILYSGPQCDQSTYLGHADYAPDARIPKK